jgi:hypothetical protein
MPNGTKRTPIEVMRALDTLGATVAPMAGKAGSPNLLVGYDGDTHAFFLNPRGKLTGPQKRWAKAWEGAEPAIVSDVEGLLATLKVPAKERAAILEEGDTKLRQRFAMAARKSAKKSPRKAAKKAPGAKRGRGRRPGRPAGRGRRASAAGINSTEPSTSAQA